MTAFYNLIQHWNCIKNNAWKFLRDVVECVLIKIIRMSFPVCRCHLELD